MLDGSSNKDIVNKGGKKVFKQEKQKFKKKKKGICHFVFPAKLRSNNNNNGFS